MPLQLKSGHSKKKKKQIIKIKMAPSLSHLRPVVGLKIRRDELNSNNRLKPLLATFQYYLNTEVYLQNVKHPSDSSKKNLYSLRFSKKKIQPRKWFVAVVNKY